MRAFTLRPALPEDRDLLYQLKKSVNYAYVSALWGWDEDFQQAEFDRDFQKREEFSVIVWEGGDAGFLQLQRGADFLNVAEIHLLPPFRGRGLAEQTVRRLIGDARALGCRRMVLDTFPFLAEAIHLYKKLGFREIESYNGAPMPDLIYLGLDLEQASNV